MLTVPCCSVFNTGESSLAAILTVAPPSPTTTYLFLEAADHNGGGKGDVRASAPSKKWLETLAPAVHKTRHASSMIGLGFVNRRGDTRYAVSLSLSLFFQCDIIGASG